MKKLLAIVLAAVLLLSLCACKKSDEAVQRPAFAFVHRAEESEYTAGLEEGFRSLADTLGYDCKAVKPENDTAEAQNKLIEELIKQGVRGIALNANQKDGMEEVLKKAQDAGIPVVTVGSDTKGSQLLIEPSTPKLVGEAAMDAMLELTGGEGKFVVLSGEYPFSDIDFWISGMQEAAKDRKYEKLIWAETNYGYDVAGGVEAMKTLILELMAEHPDLEAIYCNGTKTLAACSQAIEAFDLGLRVTGLGEESQMKDLMGKYRACPFYFFWNPQIIGACAAYAVGALREGTELKDNGELRIGSRSYDIYAGDTPAGFYMVVGEPYCYGEENRTEVETETEQTIEQKSTVFNIEKITQIAFRGNYGNGADYEVDSEHMTEVIKWLNSFDTEKEAAPDPLPTGINLCYVVITYEDGMVVESGLDAVEVDGVMHYTTYDFMSDYIWGIVSQLEQVG